MVPRIAAILCIIFIAYLFRADRRKPDQPSGAIWIPLTWMFLAGSRWVSSWLEMNVAMQSASDYAEGSPIDRAVFFSLIVAGVFILARRKINWAEVLGNNKWLVFYLIYCLTSIAWADEPFILFKRWVKDLGNPIMVLVILTERHPYAAIAFVLRRLAFLLLPLSVLFVKYYPDLGRAYHVDGTLMFTGVGHQKNDLGLMCLTAGIYAFWEILQNRQPGTKATAVILILMLAWLLHLSNSQTSLACLAVAVSLFVAGRSGFIRTKPSRLIGLVVYAALVYWILQGLLDIKGLVLGLLGRNPSLTNRTEVWATLKQFEVNPIFGAGFMSFWSGQRLEAIWEILGAGINQAHNGYLEQYLNLGYIGVMFIAAIMLKGLLSTRKHLDIDPPASMLRLSFIVTAALYNYTEASFYGMNNMWILLLLACIDPPARREAQTAPYPTSIGQGSRAMKAHTIRSQPLSPPCSSRSRNRIGTCQSDKS